MKISDQKGAQNMSQLSAAITRLAGIGSRLTEKRKATQEAEVSFPIYSRHDLEGGVIYMRTDSNGRKFTIYRRERGDATDYELTAENVSFEGAEPDYLLGKGQFSSSKAEFDLALMRAMTFLKQIDDQ